MSRAVVLMLVVTATGCRFGFQEQMSVVADAEVDAPIDIAIDPDAMIVTRTFGERSTAMTSGVTIDASIYQHMADLNLGLDATFSVDGGSTSLERTLMRFDVSSIAPGTPVVGARLNLVVEDLGDQIDGDIAVFATGESWNEDVVTWNTRDTSLPWATGGGSMGSQLDAVLPGATDVTFTIPVGLVQAWVDDASSNHGVVLNPLVESSDTHYHFYSSESPMLTARPVLSIDLAL